MEKRLGKKTAYKFKIVRGDDASKVTVEVAYCNAFRKGYSVVEIARLAGVKSAKFIHAALVRKGEIMAGKSGPQIRGSLPPKMKIHLTTRGLTFSQWCAGWGFDQQEVKKEVEERSGIAMAAIKVDFPSYYKLLTGMEVDDNIKPERFVKQITEANIRWIEENEYYKATITSGGVGYGPSMQIALRAAQTESWMQTIASRMDALPDKNDMVSDVIW